MELETQQLAEALRKQIRTQMNDYADDMINGTCGSFERYREQCGLIRGLGLAESMLIALAKNIDEEGDK